MSRKEQEERSILACDLTRKLIHQIPETRSRNGKKHGFECTVINRWYTISREKVGFIVRSTRMYKYNNGIRTTPTRAHAAHLHKIPCNFESWRWSSIVCSVYIVESIERDSLFDLREWYSREGQVWSSKNLPFQSDKRKEMWIRLHDPFFYDRSTFVR